jgi:hypothetical protein
MRDRTRGRSSPSFIVISAEELPHDEPDERRAVGRIVAAMLAACGGVAGAAKRSAGFLAPRLGRLPPAVALIAVVSVVSPAMLLAVAPETAGLEQDGAPLDATHAHAGSSDGGVSPGLGAREVHVWYVLTDAVRDADLLAAYARLLAPKSATGGVACGWRTHSTTTCSRTLRTHHAVPLCPRAPGRVALPGEGRTGARRSPRRSRRRCSDSISLTPAASSRAS